MSAGASFLEVVLVGAIAVVGIVALAALLVEAVRHAGKLGSGRHG